MGELSTFLGKLTDLNGDIPHPNGKIAVSYQLAKNKWAIGIHYRLKRRVYWFGRRMCMHIRRGRIY
jgi:hypothetical protein